VKKWRRYEVLLPLRFNDGKPVPAAAIRKAIQQLKDRFGAVSSETQIIHGRWRPKGDAREDLIRIYVDAEQSPEVHAFFLKFKREAKEQFRQTEIWLTSHPVDVL